MKKNKLVIIGAGIGGLTTAIALQKQGIDFEIYESFSEMKDLGAGIMLANNAMQVFKALDIDKKLTEQGNVFRSLNIRNPKMDVLTKSSTTDYSPDPIDTVAIHRSRLQEVLLAQIPPEKCHFGKRLVSMKEDSAGVTLHFVDGEICYADAVIGADGIHSIVRKQLYGESEIRSANQNCWRGISKLDLPEEYSGELNEIWAPGCRFGFVMIGQKTVYWYALKDDETEEQFSKKDLIDLFQSFHPVVNTIIEACPDFKILNNPIKDLKPISSWTKGVSCLIGDAAHATTPNLGQGACQSIEDGLVLAACLAKYEDYETAFNAFQSLRMKKATWVVNQSWKVGKLSHLKNGLLVSLRNGVLKRIPKSFQRKQNGILFKLSKVD